MTCERCRTYHASVHVTEVVNGFRREIHLCDECAKKAGVTLSGAIDRSKLQKPPEKKRRRRKGKV